ncbi:unnamed protein product [Schistocephalus solidus]|uniref:Sec23_trunk domain-containing protein n=1 Tax=Schistocephalus solidus TaxID=70667 RepID=A0A183TGA9_SCHSO|nr:unnamed protein product [Schistocephalus solidus]
MLPTTSTPTPWDPSQVWWYTQGRLRPRQPPAPSPISGLLDSALTLGSGGAGGDSAVAAAQGYYHLKLIHVQFTVPAPPGVEHTVDLVEIDGRTVILTMVNVLDLVSNLTTLSETRKSATVGVESSPARCVSNAIAALKANADTLRFSVVSLDDSLMENGLKNCFQVAPYAFSTVF